MTIYARRRLVRLSLSVTCTLYWNTEDIRRRWCYPHTPSFPKDYWSRKRAGYSEVYFSSIFEYDDSHGQPSNQEDFYAFATLSLDPQELAGNLKKYHKISWDPQSVGNMFADQLTFIGIYDGYALCSSSLHIDIKSSRLGTVALQYLNSYAKNFTVSSNLPKRRTFRNSMSLPVN